MTRFCSYIRGAAENAKLAESQEGKDEQAACHFRALACEQLLCAIQPRRKQRKIRTAPVFYKVELTRGEGA